MSLLLAGKLSRCCGATRISPSTLKGPIRQTYKRSGVHPKPLSWLDNAKPELIELADLATEMTLLKHPFKSGIKAQAGVEF